MASITKRTNKDGTSHWRVIIRLKGHPLQPLRSKARSGGALEHIRSADDLMHHL